MIGKLLHSVRNLSGADARCSLRPKEKMESLAKGESAMRDEGNERQGWDSRNLEDPEDDRFKGG